MITQLQKKDSIEKNEKLNNTFINFENLLINLKEKDLPEDIISAVNESVAALNSFEGTDKAHLKAIVTEKSKILLILQKQLGLVPKNYYRNLWMALGMSAFGIPLGLCFSLILDNFAFLGIGLPIGIAVGIAVGSGMDVKAEKEGKQLNIDIYK